MSRLEALEARARQLLSQGSLSRSQCGASLIQLVQPLLDAGVLEWERSGSGQRLSVRTLDAARAFLLQRFPALDSETAGAEGAPARVQGLARYRDSKAMANDTPEIVCTRIWKDECLSLWGKPTVASLLTAQHGVFSFVLGAESPYALHGVCALVENPTVFSSFDRLATEAGLVIHGRGRISDRLLDWMAAQLDPDFCLVHFPDYDPVGLDEFLRLRSKLAGRVRLHCPPHLPDLFARYSKPGLLANPHSRTILERLRHCEDSLVQRVVALIDHHSGGLEQESLLV